MIFTYLFVKSQSVWNLRQGGLWKEHVQDLENLEKLDHELWLVLVLGLAPDHREKETYFFLEKCDVGSLHIFDDGIDYIYQLVISILFLKNSIKEC